jgi:hypothetical protein
LENHKLKIGRKARKQFECREQLLNHDLKSKGMVASIGLKMVSPVDDGDDCVTVSPLIE